MVRCVSPKCSVYHTRRGKLSCRRPNSYIIYYRQRSAQASKRGRKLSYRSRKFKSQYRRWKYGKSAKRLCSVQRRLKRRSKPRSVIRYKLVKGAKWPKGVHLLDLKTKL